MIEILISILISSLYCIGIWIITDEGYILYDVKLIGDKLLPRWLYKPLFGCVVCYGSIHGGTMFYLLTQNYILLIPAMVCISGLNYIIVNKLLNA